VQLQQVKKMGPLSQLLEMIPGFASASRQLPSDLTDKQMKRVEAMVSSMTRAERKSPDILNASRRRRIAQGSGTSVQEVNQLLRQFQEMQKMIKQLASGKGRGLLSMFR
jgi:signal recognition particle subunit SRP54